MVEETTGPWPIAYRESLTLGNTESNVGVCTLWARKEEFLGSMDSSMFSVVGNLYTIQGVNPLIRNVIANPKIRYIVICGEDQTGSGRALINLVERGITSRRQIVDSNGFIDEGIDEASLDAFRKNVNILDMRSLPPNADRAKKVSERIGSLNPLPPFAEPRIISEKSASASSLDSDQVGFFIEEENVSSAWLRLVDNVMKFGDVKATAYGGMQREILDAMVVFPGGNLEGYDDFEKWIRVGKKELDEYSKTFFGKDKPVGLSYTYGERLFGFSNGNMKEKIDQIRHAVEDLKKTPHSRRSIAITWKADEDLYSKEPPCMTQVVWSVQKGRLHQTATFRSHDIFGAWPLNVYALNMLQHDFSEQLGIPPGVLVVVSNSAHIYENNWERATNVLLENLSGRHMGFVPDKKGYFVVSVEGSGNPANLGQREIVVQHRLNDGRKSDYVFGGIKANSLYRRILNENLISKLDHAAYLGKELARAEECLENGNEYVQDEA
jgi:thymidylate synthase